MGNNIEIDERIVAAIKRSKQISTVQIADEFKVSEEYINDLNMLENVLRLNKWNKESEKIINAKTEKFRINWSIFSSAASLFFIVGFSYLALNKNFISDIIVENEILREAEKAVDKQNMKPQELAYQEFITGKASYYSKEYGHAAISYRKVLQTPNLRIQFREAVQWHLCVAYLQNNEPVNCELILKEIEEIDNPKYHINTLDMIKLKTQLWLKKTFSNSDGSNIKPTK
jgi:hypothetical protein